MKRFLKEKKGIMISFIIGVIIASSITVYATSYFAKDITYKDGKSVADALNYLYENQNELRIASSNSRGVFSIPQGITKAYIIYETASTGTKEYTLNVNSSIMKNSPIEISNQHSVDDFFSKLMIYKLELTGEAGEINCSVSGANGQNAYQINLVY